MFVRVRFPVPVAMGVRCGLSNRHDEAAVLDAFEADEAVGEALDAGRGAVDDQDLEAGVVIEVGVAGRDDQVVVLMLEAGELISDAVGIVVVDEGDGANDGGVGGGGAFGDEAVANEIAEGFRAVGVAAAGDGAVELCEEGGIESDADAAELTHETCLSH